MKKKSKLKMPNPNNARLKFIPDMIIPITAAIIAPTRP